MGVFHLYPYTHLPPFFSKVYLFTLPTSLASPLHLPIHSYSQIFFNLAFGGCGNAPSANLKKSDYNSKQKVTSAVHKQCPTLIIISF